MSETWIKLESWQDIFRLLIHLLVHIFHSLLLDDKNDIFNWNFHIKMSRSFICHDSKSSTFHYSGILLIKSCFWRFQTLKPHWQFRQQNSNNTVRVPVTTAIVLIPLSPICTVFKNHLNVSFFFFNICEQLKRWLDLRAFCICFDLPKFIHSTAEFYQNSPHFVNKLRTIFLVFKACFSTLCNAIL